MVSGKSLVSIKTIVIVDAASVFLLQSAQINLSLYIKYVHSRNELEVIPTIHI